MKMTENENKNHMDFIHGLGNLISHLKTVGADIKYPKPDEIPDYDKEIEVEIHKLMHENTGVHICDSGGQFGRAWQQRRMIKDFRNNPEIHKEVYSDEMLINVDMWHYLTRNLDVNSVSKALDAELQEFAENSEQYGYGLAREFASHLKEQGAHIIGTCNTYNGACVLNGTIQFIGFSLNKNHHGYPDYIIFQLHNGADVRGGYTKPRIFEVVGEYWRSFHEASAQCPVCGDYWSTDTAGYEWFKNGNWGDKENSWVYLPDENEVYHNHKNPSTGEWDFDPETNELNVDADAVEPLTFTSILLEW